MSTRVLYGVWYGIIRESIIVECGDRICIYGSAGHEKPNLLNVHLFFSLGLMIQRESRLGMNLYPSMIQLCTLTFLSPSSTDYFFYNQKIESTDRHKTKEELVLPSSIP